MNVNCAALRSMNRNRLQWGPMRERGEGNGSTIEEGLSIDGWGLLFSFQFMCLFLILLFFSQCWVLMDRDWDKTDFLSSFIMKDIVYWEPSGAEKRARLSFLFLYVSWFHFIPLPSLDRHPHPSHFAFLCHTRMCYLSQIHFPTIVEGRSFHS